jgi:hypothetical protein
VTVAAQEDNPVSRPKRYFKGDCLADRARCTGDQRQTMIMILIGVSHGIPDVYGKFKSDTTWVVSAVAASAFSYWLAPGHSPNACCKLCCILSINLGSKANLMASIQTCQVANCHLITG